MSLDIPSTDVIRHWCGWGADDDFSAIRVLQFEAWLEGIKKEAVADFFTENGLSYRARALKEKAWREGHDAGIEDAAFEPVDHTLNPYRSWETE